MKSVIFLVIFVLQLKIASSQCLTPDFSLPAEVCLNQSIKISSEDYENYEWDFCAGDLDQAPDASIFLNTAGSAFNVEVVEESGQYYGFYTSRGTGNMYRLDFGKTVTGTPVPVSLGTLGLNSPGWLTIKIVKENDTYFGFIIDYYNKVYRINFGSSVTNRPGNAELLYHDGLLSNPIDLEIVSDETGKYAFIANSSSNNMTRLLFSNSFGNLADDISSSNLAVSGIGSLSGVSFKKECEHWYAMAASSTGEIAKLLFDDGLNSAPVISIVTGLSFTPGPLGGISIAFENSKYFVFAQSRETSSDLYKIDFGSSLANSVQASANLGNFGLLSGIWGFSMHKAKSTWLVLSSENTGNNIYRISFPENCFSDLKFSTQPENILATTSSGNFYLSLTISDDSGNQATVSKEISITATTAPDIDFATENNCVDNVVNFTSSNQSGQIVNSQWDFGDGTTLQENHLTNPAHNYSVASTYYPSLIVTAANGCENLASDTIKIYDSPVASFTLPSGLICTNNQFTFINTTSGNFDDIISYQWSVQNNEVSTDEDLKYTFTSEGDQTIKLKASIPGCSSEITKFLSGVQPGPAVDFTSSGNCEDKPVKFENAVVETVNNYLWDFGDQQSNAPDASYTYPTPGTYQVTLTVVGLNGCNTTREKTVNIFSNPHTNFKIVSDPPYCTEKAIQFTDLTTSNLDAVIESREWKFGDDGVATDQSSDHIFTAAGSYIISLTTVTTAGCSNVLTKTLTVKPTPNVSFSADRICVGIPTVFKGSSNDEVSSWHWQIGDKVYATAEVTHTFRTAGNFDLQVTAESVNGCEAVLNTQLSVPVGLTPDFSVARNCVGEQATFLDVTSQNDPVAHREWAIDGEATDEASNEFSTTFKNEATHFVTLSLVGESGCNYSTTKEVVIVPAPEASFSMSSEIGSPPFPVNFTNRSSNADQYLWDFGDNTTSTDTSPDHTYSYISDFNVILTAISEEGCQDSETKKITISPSAPDVTILAITETENPNGTTSVTIILQNDGNTILENLPVSIDISGKVNLVEIIPGPVFPKGRVNLPLGYSLVTNQQEFLCASADLQNDVVPSSNRNCLNFKSLVEFFPVYPNPVRNWLNIEWISANTNPVHASVYNTFGNMIMDYSFESQKGINKKDVNVTDLQKGVYLLILEANGNKTIQRVLLTR